MRKLLAYLGAFCLLVGAAKDDSLSKAERERGVQHLQKTKKAVLDATKGLSDAQWNFKSAPDRWSVAEVLEHIAKSEDYLSKLASEQAMKGPPRPAGVNLKEIDELVLAQIPNRSQKAEAPQPLRPSNEFGSPADTLKHFVESRDKTIKYLETTHGLRDHAMDSRIGKKLDPYQWLLFVSAHSERHTKQINEVKADPKFPKA